MKFLDLFNEIEKGNYALTDEAIYSSLHSEDELIPLYGGNQEHETISRKISVSAKTKKNQSITVFCGEGIIISLDGSAGYMTYKNNEKFALNHHAGFITVRDDMKKMVNLKYFSLFFKNHYRAMAVSDGSKTLSLQQIYSDEISLPDIEKQNKVVELLEKRFINMKKLLLLKKKIENIIEKDVIYAEKDYIEKNIPISKFATIIQGHQITDEEIYISEGNIPVYTGKNDLKGYWQNSIISESDLPCITYATKAFDGTITIQNELFDANNTAVLIVKDDYKNKIKLEWLKTVLPSALLKMATSKEGVSYLNKDIVEDMTISIPKIEKQNQCIEKIEKFNSYLRCIRDIEERYTNLISKEVFFED